MPPTVTYLADSILYLTTLIADQPRSIDRYIDYFGEGQAVAPAASGRTGRRGASR